MTVILHIICALFVWLLWYYVRFCHQERIRIKKEYYESHKMD